MTSISLIKDGRVFFVRVCVQKTVERMRGSLSKLWSGNLIILGGV